FFPIGLKLKDAHFKIGIPKDSLLIQWEGNLSYAKVGGVDWLKAWKENTWDVGTIKIGEGDVHWIVQKQIVLDTSRFAQNTNKKSPDFLNRNTNVEQLKLRFERDALTVNLQTSIVLDTLSVLRRDSVQWNLGRVQFLSKDALFENVVP